MEAKTDLDKRNAACKTMKYLLSQQNFMDPSYARIIRGMFKIVGSTEDEWGKMANTAHAMDNLTRVAQKREPMPSPKDLKDTLGFALMTEDDWKEMLDQAEKSKSLSIAAAGLATATASAGRAV